jgi:hypothetical protein
MDWFISVLGLLLSFARDIPMSRTFKYGHWSTTKLQYLHYRSGRALLARGESLVPPWIDPVTFKTLSELEEVEQDDLFEKE